MAALQFVDVPGYSALLLRKTFRDLNQADALIPRSKEWLMPKVPGGWGEQSKRWTFPSGATLQFGYLDNPNDVYQYQGAAYQFVGFDELTQFPEMPYRYLFSRLRRPMEGPLSRVPLRMRSGTNPGGAGHEWVKRRFIKPGGKFFVPALLQENPYLDQHSYMESLANLDPITRARLLAGDWADFACGRFRPEWFRFYKNADAAGNYWQFGEKKYHKETIKGRFLTCDAAATVKETAKDDPDYTVICSWGKTPCGLLVALGCLRIRVEVPDIIPAAAREYSRWECGKGIFEGGGMQNAVPQLARRHRLANGTHMNVVSFNPGARDKLDRAADMLNMAEAGRIWLPLDHADYPLEEVKAELLRFTGDPKQDGHDDIVDNFAMAGLEMSSNNIRYDTIGEGKFGVARPGIQF